MIDSEGKLKISVILYLGVICGVLSFSPFGGSGIFKIGMYLCFGVYLVLMLIRKDMKIQVNGFARYMVCAYVIWTAITALFNLTGIYPHSSIGVVALLQYCLFFYCVGYNIFYDQDSKIGLYVILSFVIGTLIFTAMTIGQIRSISRTIYTFGGKNQTGQVLGIGIILLMFVLPEYCVRSWQKIACNFLAALMLMALLQLRSRTPLVGVGATFLIWFVRRKEKQMRDYLNLVAIVIVATGVILYFGGIEFLTEIFFGKLESSVSCEKSAALDIVLSGRIGIWKEALTDFMNNPITGVGAWAYIDNHFLNILRTGGLLLAALIFPISYGKMYTVYRRIKQNRDDVNDSKLVLVNTLSLLIPFLFLISLMEGHPPLGPGASMFLYWLLVGIYDQICCEEKQYAG